MHNIGAHGSVVGWSTVLQTFQVMGSMPDEVIGVFKWPDPSSRTMALS
jgi:hypothetical protein